MSEPGVIRPDPDPTSRTVDLVTRDLESLEKLLNSRLDAIEKAQATFHETITRVPTEVQRAISGLREVVEKEFAVHEEKFFGIARILEERKSARAFETASNEKAIDRAFAASKESYAENKSAFEKRIDGITATIDTGNKTNDGRINDLKDRLTNIEATTRALSESRIEHRADTNTSINSAGLILAVVGLLVGLAVSYVSRPQELPANFTVNEPAR